MTTSQPGFEVAIQIPWRAWTTAAAGLVACETPFADQARGFAKWQLTHAPTGRVIAWLDGPEQVQAVAARLTDIDWLAADLLDNLRSILERVHAVVDDLAGEFAQGPGMSPWSPSSGVS